MESKWRYTDTNKLEAKFHTSCICNIWLWQTAERHFFSPVANEMTSKLPNCRSNSHRRFWFKYSNLVGQMVKKCYDSSNIFKFRQCSLCLVWIALLKEIYSSFQEEAQLIGLIVLTSWLQSFYSHHSTES